MKKSGQITVFLSLILVCVCSLVCGLLESARTAGSRLYLQTAANSSMDSLFSTYHRQMWDSYRIFLLEYDKKKDLEHSFEEFMVPYLEVENWYHMKPESCLADPIIHITDEGGTYLETEILDYMKYGVWKLDLDLEHAQELTENLKEAVAVSTVSDTYTVDTREALKLERALEAIKNSLKTQENAAQAAMRRLGLQDGSGFKKETRKLTKEMKRLPGLIKTYEKRADDLGKSLEKTEEAFELNQGELSEETKAAFMETFAHYEAYTASDGKRRLEVKALQKITDENEEIANRAIEAADEVEEIIDQWEDSEDEEGDSLDEGALWESVEEVFRDCTIPELSFSPGVKDPKKMEFLEQVSRMADLGILSLVLPEGKEVSKGYLDTAQFPSATAMSKGEDTGLINRMLTNEYCIKFFSQYSTPETKAVQYELEYLLAGEDTDEANLKQTVDRLLLMREGMNLIHILSDSSKREQARALAYVIAGGVPLAELLTFFIMGIWAFGEAVVDVKSLMNEKKVPLFKTAETWNLELEGLLNLGAGGALSEGKDVEGGLDYTGYLRLLLFLEQPDRKYYRMMDIMQLNIKRTQSDFLMDHSAYSVDIKAKLCGKHSFFSLWLLKRPSGGSPLEYPLQVTAGKRY